MKSIMLAVLLTTQSVDTLVNDPARTLPIRGDIGEDSSTHAITKLKLFNQVKGQPIFIYIASYGGSVELGQNIIREIEVSRALGNTVKCIAVGPVMSMAMHIYNSCDQRYATGNAEFMWHFHTLKFPESQPLPLLRAALEYAEARQEALLARLRENLGMEPEAFLNHAFAETTWPAGTLKQVAPDYFTIIRTTRPK